VLGLIYVFLIAKPISIRRLFLLFVIGLTLTPSVLAILHVKDSPSHALAIATSVVLLVWSLPLVRIVHDTIRLGRLSLDALSAVSDAVRWTYGLALLAVPMLTIGCLFNPAHRLMLAAIPPFMAIAALAVLVLHARLDLWRQPRLPLDVSRYQHRASGAECRRIRLQIDAAFAGELTRTSGLMETDPLSRRPGIDAQERCSVRGARDAKMVGSSWLDLSLFRVKEATRRDHFPPKSRKRE
jgi:hypothetical protein